MLWIYFKSPDTRFRIMRPNKVLYRQVRYLHRCGLSPLRRVYRKTVSLVTFEFINLDLYRQDAAGTLWGFGGTGPISTPPKRYFAWNPRARRVQDKRKSIFPLLLPYKKMLNVSRYKFKRFSHHDRWFKARSRYRHSGRRHSSHPPHFLGITLHSTAKRQLE